MLSNRHLALITYLRSAFFDAVRTVIIREKAGCLTSGLQAPFVQPQVSDCSMDLFVEISMRVWQNAYLASGTAAVVSRMNFHSFEIKPNIDFHLPSCSSLATTAICILLCCVLTTHLYSLVVRPADYPGLTLETHHRASTVYFAAFLRPYIPRVPQLE